MSKYAPLTRYLASREAAQVPMTFAEIEAVLGFALPRSARTHRAFWSNSPRNSVMTQAWRQAGFRSKAVDLDAARLLFERLNAVDRDRPQPDHPLWGCMAGTVTFAPDFDPTEPALSPEDLAEWEANLDLKARRIAGEDV